MLVKQLADGDSGGDSFHCIRPLRTSFLRDLSGYGYSILAGSATLSIMICTYHAHIGRGIEVGAGQLPGGSFDWERKASYGSEDRAARGGQELVGVILAVGRIIGETAALLYTAGTVAKLPADLFSSARTLSVHMYLLSSEGFNTDEAYATAVVLLLVVLSINTLSAAIAKKVTKV